MPFLHAIYFILAEFTRLKRLRAKNMIKQSLL